MTPIADMVRQMLEKGVAAEAIVIAVQGAELAAMSAPRPQTSADESADRRREKDRLRKQAARGNPQKSADICGNPQTESLSKTLIITKSPSVERGASKAVSADKRGQRLPEGWQPRASDWAEAQRILGFRAAAELLNFRDYWIAKPGHHGVKTDWDATWRRWARKAVEYGNGKTTDNPRAGSLIGSIHRELAALQSEEDSDPQMPGGDLFGVSR